MKILLVTEFFPQNKKRIFTGGVEARTYYLWKYLKQNHSVEVISRPATQVSVSFLSVFSRLIFIIEAIIKGISCNADIVEGSNFVSYIPAFIIAKIKKIPAVAWYPDVFIGSWIQKFGFVGIFGEITERISLALPWDHIIALSNQTKHKLIKAGINAKKISVVYAGIDKNEMVSIKIKKNNNPTLICISRLVSYKRVGDLIKAFSIVRKKISNTNLIIIGTGPQEKKLKQFAKKLNLKNITWKKHVTRKNLLKHLKQSHLLCHPSIVEGFGLVTLEALTSGVPYINADITINREITHNGKGGLLFKPKNPGSLAKQIIMLLTNKQLYKKKIIEGKQLLSRYSWKKSAQETRIIYIACIK